MWHLTPDIWHQLPDTWHVTYATGQVVKIVSKVQVPSSDGLGFMLFQSFGGKEWPSDWITESVAEVFVEQPLPLRIFLIPLDNKVFTLYCIPYFYFRV